jgi:hypothetical protein
MQFPQFSCLPDLVVSARIQHRLSEGNSGFRSAASVFKRGSDARREGTRTAALGKAASAPGRRAEFDRRPVAVSPAGRSGQPQPTTATLAANVIHSLSASASDRSSAHLLGQGQPVGIEVDDVRYRGHGGKRGFSRTGSNCQPLPCLGKFSAVRCRAGPGDGGSAGSHRPPGWDGVAGGSLVGGRAGRGRSCSSLPPC